MNRRFRGVLTRSRGGFTLVELLVVISIIGMLAALLLPAVNSAREAGRKSVCINNQRQVGLAVFQYEAAKNAYPGYVIPQAEIVDVTSKANTEVKYASRPIGWAFALMSRLERQDIADNFGPNAPQPWKASDGATSGPLFVPDFRVNVLICPSDALSLNPDPEGLANSTALSYVVNTGLKDDDSTTTFNGTTINTDVTSPSPGTARDWAANGIFHYAFPYTGPDSSTGQYTKNNEKITKVTSSAISDGTSTTLILSENVDSGSWTDVLEQDVGFYWQATADSSTLLPSPQENGPLEFLKVKLLKINEEAGQSVVTPGPRFGRPSSFHPGGVVVTYADAHSSFLSADVDYLVYCQIMSPRGKYTLPAGVNGIDQSTGAQKLFLDGNIFPPATDGRAKYARSTLNEEQL